MPNRLYSDGMVPSDFWDSVQKRLGKEGVKLKDFYAHKFALWIDLRTHPDNSIHGGGLALNDTRDGVNLQWNEKLEDRVICPATFLWYPMRCWRS